MPIGTSRCAHWFAFEGVNCLHCLSPEMYFWSVGVHQSSLCSQVLVLPLGAGGAPHQLTGPSEAWGPLVPDAGGGGCGEPPLIPTSPCRSPGPSPLSGLWEGVFV